MGKVSSHRNDRIKYFKCEICLKDIPIEYYFTPGDTITCNGCNMEYNLISKEPLELAMQSVNQRDIDYDEIY